MEKFKGRKEFYDEDQQERTGFCAEVISAGQAGYLEGLAEGEGSGWHC